RFLVRFCVSDMYGLTTFGLEPDSVERVVYIPDLTLIVMSQGRHVYLTFPFPTYTGQLSFRLTSRARNCRRLGPRQTTQHPFMVCVTSHTHSCSCSTPPVYVV